MLRLVIAVSLSLTAAFEAPASSVAQSLANAAVPAAAALDQPASVEAASRRLPPSIRRPRAGPPPPLSGPTVAAVAVSQPDGGGGGDGGWSAMGLVGLIVLTVGGAVAAAVGYRALSNPDRKPCALF